MNCYTSPSPPKEWIAKWIWSSPLKSMDNLHLLFRRKIILNDLNSRAACWISANNVYELYINAQLIGRGPSPSFPEWQYFDYYEINRFLKKGPNIIAAWCYNYGETHESILQQSPGPGGLLMQMEVGGKIVLSTDDSWRLCRDPARKQQTDYISGHRGGYKEICDASREIVGWKDQDFNDSRWVYAHVLGPVGCNPWKKLIPREIPSLRLETVLPKDIFYITSGKTYGAAKYDVAGTEALRQESNGTTIVHPLRGDFAPSLIIDFGKSLYGFFEIEIEESKGGVIEICYGESLNLTLVDTLIMRKGHQTYRPFERRGGRYVMLTFRNCPGPVRIRRVVYYRQSYPTEQKGKFTCSDDRLNRIWETGCYTVQMCMQDHYEDCPWREQTLYAGDLAVGSLLSYYAFGVQDLARKCLRQFARLQDKDGLIPDLGPAPMKGMMVVPEYPAFWIIGLWRYYWHWGDASLIKELYPNVIRCMDWYAAHHDRNGMFVRSGRKKFMKFVDNLSNIAASDKLAAEQIIYCQACRAAASMAELTGELEKAKEFRSRSQKLAKAIEHFFWNENQHCLVDSLVPGKETVTQITNGLALLFNIVSDERRPQCAEILLDPTRSPPMRAGYMNFHMIEALFGLGLNKEALDRMREYWGGMLDRGATTFWETYDPDTPDGTIPERLWSLCHEYCSGPVYSLPAHVAGIKAIEPGFQRVEIAPHFEDLAWVNAQVATPRGTVKIMGRQTSDTKCMEIEVDIPPNVSAEILVPLPGRDIGTVYVDDKPVSSGMKPEHLCSIHSNLTKVSRESTNLRLSFGASHVSEHIRITTRKAHLFPSGWKSTDVLYQPWQE